MYQRKIFELNLLQTGVPGPNWLKALSRVPGPIIQRSFRPAEKDSPRRPRGRLPFNIYQGAPIPERQIRHGGPNLKASSLQN